MYGPRDRRLVEPRARRLEKNYFRDSDCKKRRRRIKTEKHARTVYYVIPTSRVNE